MALYVCQVCAGKGEEFSLPADSIGMAIMQQHFQDKHREIWVNHEHRLKAGDAEATRHQSQ